MPAINFSVFKDKLVKGEKIHTIRKSLPKGWKKGKPLSLYTGMRTKGCHKLVDTFCDFYLMLNIDSKKKSVSMCSPNNPFNILDVNVEKLAKDDGFKSVEDFWDFFKDYIEPCYLLYFDRQNFTPTKWALEALERGILF